MVLFYQISRPLERGKQRFFKKKRRQGEYEHLHRRTYAGMDKEKEFLEQMERMLRLYLLQDLCSLSDGATMSETIDSRTFPEFCGVKSSNQVPDGDTLRRFKEGACMAFRL
jgi:hypothetical protein